MGLPDMRQLWSLSPEQTWSRIQTRLRLRKSTSFEHHYWCLSTGRVGTATIASLVNTVPNIYSAHEPEPHLFGLGLQAYKNGNEIFDEILNESIASCRRNLSGLDQDTYLESSPQVTFLAKHLLNVFPDSRFIHVVRHPVGVVSSGMNRQWYSGNTTDQWRIYPQPDAQFSDSWMQWGAFEKNVWSWYETNRWISSFCSGLSEQQYIRIASEKLFSGDEHVIEKLFRFVGADSFDRRKVDRLLSRRMNSNKTRIFPTYAEWSTDHKNVIEKISGSLIDDYGYRLE